MASDAQTTVGRSRAMTAGVGRASMVRTICMVLAGCAAPLSRTEAVKTPQAQRSIEIQGVRLRTAGYMLDFRYRAVDAEKVSTITRTGIKPYREAEETGARLGTRVPATVGPLRQAHSRVIRTREYFVFFANPGCMDVAVVAGDMPAEHLVVQ